MKNQSTQQDAGSFAAVAHALSSVARTVEEQSGLSTGLVAASRSRHPNAVAMTILTRLMNPSMNLVSYSSLLMAFRIVTKAPG